MAKDQKAYFKGWYEKNAEELAAKRKARYESDPEYAERAKERTRLGKMAKRLERQKERLKTGAPLRVAGGGPRKPVPVVMPSGKVVQGYTVGEVARRLGKSYHTLKKWRQIGVLPASPLKTDMGHGLYTEAMIDVLKSAVAKRIDVSVSDKSFTEEVVAGWEQALRA